jgi:hypothetical protein
MSVVFDYSGKLNGCEINPRSQYEVLMLVYSTGYCRGPDGSHGEIYRQASALRGKPDVRVLCPPHIVWNWATDYRRTFNEWLFVSFKGDIYLIDLDTTVQPSGIWNSLVANISTKNPVLAVEEKGIVKKVPAKDFVKWWLKECRMKPAEGT